MLGSNFEQVLAIAVAAELASQHDELLTRDIASAVRDLFDASHLQTLAFLYCRHEVGRLKQRLVRAGI